MDIAEFEEQDARRRALERRERKPTSRAVEGAEQVHLRFNARLTPAQMDRERSEREQARAARLQANTQTDGPAFQKSDLVWARFDRWCARLTAAELVWPQHVEIVAVGDKRS